MRRLSIIAIGLLTLGACNAEPDTARPTEQAAEAPASDGVATGPVVLAAADLRRVCRAGLAAVHGQTVDAIEIEGLTGDVVTAGWRAPVDGGRSRAECRIEGDVVTWKPLDLPDPTKIRWMNQSGDPVLRFALDGATVTINQTLPDGTTASEDYSVAAVEEAR